MQTLVLPVTSSRTLRGKSRVLSLQGSPEMANYTSAPDDYDVLIDDDVNISDTEQCTRYDPKTLSTQLVPWLHTVVFLMGLLDNLLLLLILVKYKTLRHVENIYFLNLAVSNLCFLLPLPFQAYRASNGGLLGSPLCKVLVALSSVGLLGEAFFNVLLTVQRYLVFCHIRSLSSAARKVPCGICTSVLAWVTATLVSLPEFLPFKSQVGVQSPQHRCSWNELHFPPDDKTFWKRFLTLKMNVLGLLVPLLVFIVCYMLMRKTLRSRARMDDVSKLVFAIMAVFLLMWGPYGAALFLSTFRAPFALQDCRGSYNLDTGVHITSLIATSHCCVNPLLHVLLDEAFRRHLCHLFCWCDGTALRPPEDLAQGTSGEERDGSTAV